MKKYLFMALITISSISHSYNIGGSYATLVDCSWGAYGYKYGYIGTYKVQSIGGEKIYQIFFGNQYCKF